MGEVEGSVGEFRSKLPKDQETRMACLELAMVQSHGETADETVQRAKTFENYVVEGN